MTTDLCACGRANCMSAPFRSYSVTEEEAEAAGYATGNAWAHDWRPGGPHVTRDYHTRCRDFSAFCERTRLNNLAWLRGFDRGHAERTHD